MPQDHDALRYAGEQPPASIAHTPGTAEATSTVNAPASPGTELAPAPPAPRRPAAKPIWARAWVLATAAAVVGVALAGGYALRPVSPADSSGSRSLPGVVACAETVAVGNVTSVSRQGDRFAVTLEAARYLKPENGPATLSVGNARLPVGAASTEPVQDEQALVVVHANGDVDLFTGTDIVSEWAWMEKALPDSRSIDPKECHGA